MSIKRKELIFIPLYLCRVSDAVSYYSIPSGWFATVFHTHRRKSTEWMKKNIQPNTWQNCNTQKINILVGENNFTEWLRNIIVFDIFIVPLVKWHWISIFFCVKQSLKQNTRTRTVLHARQSTRLCCIETFIMRISWTRHILL